MSQPEDPATREAALAALDAALIARPDVLAVWEGGSVATGRADALSDIDLVVLAEEGAAEGVLGALEAALAPFGPMTGAYAVPEPAWHGGSQRFWQLQRLGPYVMVDVVVLGPKAPERFLEPERHGRAVVRLDRGGHAAVPPFDAARHAAAMRRAYDDAVARFGPFQSLVEKEIARGRALDALGFYHALTLRPLVQLLGMRHRPLTWDFGNRYLHDDLPPDVAARLAALHFVAGLDDLREKHRQAAAWFGELAEDGPPDEGAIAALSAAVRAGGGAGYGA